MTTTDIVLHTGRELAVAADFASNYPAIAPTAETMELMAEIMGDETLDQRNLPVIKCPPGDSDQFTYTVAGRAISTKRIKGILVHYVAQRAFWTDPNPSFVPPACASRDNKRADVGGMYGPGGEREAENPTGLCADCPMSKPRTDLKGGQMSACKEQRRLFVVLKGLLLPVIIAAPPSSIGGLKDFLVSMAMAQQGWWAIPLEFGLEKATNGTNQSFNKITIAADEEATPLGKNEEEAALAYRAYIRELIGQQPPRFDDGAPAATGGFSVGDPEAANA